MQAKYCLLFVLLTVSLLVSTDGFVPTVHGPKAGRKREVQ